MSKPTYAELEKKLKDFEQKLHELELQQLWSIYSQSPIPTLIAKKDGRFVKYNDAMAKLTGYKHEEVPDIESWMLRIYPDEKYRNKVNKIVKKSMGKEINIKRDEFIITRKDGKQCFVAFSVYDILHGGNPTDLQVVQGEDITERKRAEEALQDSEERFRSLFESAPEFIHILDKNGTILQTNPTVILQSGYTEEEIVGRSLAEFLTPASQKIFACEFPIIMEKGNHRAEVEFVYKDGTIIISDCSCIVVRNERGEFAYIVTFQRDITEQKKTEKELRESEELLRLLIESSEDVILIQDLEGKYLYYNGPPKYGIESDDVVGKKPFDLHNPEQSSKIMENLKKIIKSKESATYENQLDWQGEMLWFLDQIYPIKNAVGNVKAVATVSRNITERKKAEEELKKAKEYAHNIIDSSLDMIIAVDKDRRIVQFNKAAQETFGYSEEEIVGKHVQILYADKEEGRKIGEMILKKGTLTGEITNIRKNGETFPSLLSASIMRDQHGEIIGTVGNSRDITELKNTEEKLKFTQKELKSKAMNLEETNIALKVLLEHQDAEKKKLEKNILTSLKTLVLPYLEKIKIGTSDERQKTYVNIIETNLSEITKPFTNQFTESYSKLTPTEIQITSLVRENKTAKDIAKILDISETTVFFHRRNIRKKLGLKNKKANLRSYLQSVASG